MGGSKHVSSACLNCRRRKVKCDGNDICSNCSVSQLPCVYNAEADMRKVSAKKVIVDLKARVAQLEDLLRQNKIEQPPSSPEGTTTSKSAAPESTASGGEGPSDPTARLNIAEDAAAPIATPHPRPPASATGSLNSGMQASPLPISPSSGAGVVSGLHRPPSDAPDFLSANHMDLGLDAMGDDEQSFIQVGSTSGSHSQKFPEPALSDFDDQPETPETEGDITDILAARIGALRIAEDGQLRYYGPTSNLHVHPNGFQSLSRSTIRNVEAEGFGVLRRLGLDRKVPLSIEMHLARLYFSWEDPAIHIVDEETFFAEKQNAVLHGRKSPYYSETLNNAICAIGANLAGGEYLDLPEPAPEFFSSRAKALLDIEMDSPTVATVQALVVMSASEAAFTRDARGWLYSGMAARLSADLGLHLDVTKHTKAGLLSQRDLEIRRVAFWGVFIHEHMWSMYVGRPWGIGIRNITVSRPANQFDQGRFWKPYPRAVGQSTIPDEGLFFPLEACTDANITLCEFMRHINTTLYTGRRIDIKALVDFLTRTRRELWAWQESLIPALRINTESFDTPFVPAVLQLHMQFYAILIALNRPYLSSQFVCSVHQLESASDKDALLSAATECVSAARQVADTLRCYQRQHSLRRANIQIVHIIFTASLVLIHDVCTRGHGDSQSSRNDLQFCCHALGEIGHAFGNATRALEVIILVKSEWQRLASTDWMRRNSLNKRPSTSLPAAPASDQDDGSSRSKRRSRSSFSGPGFSDQPSFLRGPSFSAFQMLCDDYTGQSIDMTMPIIGEDMQDAWHMPLGENLGAGDMIAPPMPWLDYQDMQPSFMPNRDLSVVGLGAVPATLQAAEGAEGPTTTDKGASPV